MSGQLLKTPIAVVGMACRLPDANNLQEFWDLLDNGRDTIREMPADRLDRDLYLDERKGQRGRTYASIGGLLKDTPPPANYPESFRQLKHSDPCHRIFCEVVAEACQHAGYDPAELPTQRAGVYVGHSGGSPIGGELNYAVLAGQYVDYLRDLPGFAKLPNDTQDAIINEVVTGLRSERPHRDSEGRPDVEANMVAGCVSRVLGLDGPQMAIDAACASGLVAFALGALAVQTGETDMSIVGGSSFSKQDSLILFSQARSCSATGSRPFDADADGLVNSEGHVAFLIKTLDRALADGDQIHAVVRGLGLSSDGRGRSLWAPRKEGQVEAIRRAYTGPVEPTEIDYVEAHATSTKIGDATELSALGEFFSHELDGTRLPIGSVKSNIGHTLETAGLAGMLKVILAIQHGSIPPSINFRTPNPNVDWNELPFKVATTRRDWPTHPDRPRAGAVNAFGIGGLNVHLVVEEFHARHQSAKSESNSVRVTPREPAAIAVIGRGVVLPNSLDVGEYSQLIHGEQSAMTAAPASRWRAGEPRRGGFIHNYAYDWKTHKIPPLQIQRANPMQFMLLDAAAQALKEAGYDRKEFDRHRAAVVIGTIFGGEFSNDLHAGMRLPELTRELSTALERRGIDRATREQLCAEYESYFLKQRPALLDETGSFTSSTLASRISKTLDMMGGAMALDAGDVSSFAALSAACQLLDSQTCSVVLCGGAQRAMDLSAFESFEKHGRLSDSQGDGHLPGEGVAMVLLKNLADAERDGDTVHAVIRGVGAGADQSLQDAAIRAGRQAIRSGQIDTAAVGQVIAGNGVAACDREEFAGIGQVYPAVPQRPDPLVRQIGHIQAAHGLAMLVRSSFVDSRNDQLTALTGHTLSGLAYHIILDPTSGRVRSTRPNVSTEPVFVTNSPTVSPGQTPRILRWIATDRRQLEQQVQTAITRSEDAFQTAIETQFSSQDGIRLTVIAADANDLQRKLSLWCSIGRDGGRQATLHTEGVYEADLQTTPPRLACLFAGQGSQYAGMFRELATSSPAVRSRLEQIEACLRDAGLPSFASMAWDRPESLGRDVVATQTAILVADVLAWEAMSSLGVKPFAFAGHSYGEYAALVAAGVWSFPQALRATQARASALSYLTAGSTQMVAVRAGRDAVQPCVDRHSGVFISHFNAPEEIVIGGSTADVQAVMRELNAERIPTFELTVPCAFHTPHLAPAQSRLAMGLAAEHLLPPATPFISSVTARYTADAEDIRKNLAAQLVEPVQFVSLIERLADDGVNVFLEIGPSQVLTKLSRRILNDRAVTCFAFDHANRSEAEQKLYRQAVLETFGLTNETTTPVTTSAPTVSVPMTKTNVEKPVGPPVDFDATAARRQRRRQAAEQSRQPQPTTTTTPTSKENTEPEAAPAIDLAELKQFLVDFVIEHTGYPRDVVSLDADLEADLGIDSIKKAQLFGEFREMTQLAAEGGNGNGSINAFRTLREVLELAGEVREAVAIPEPEPTPEPVREPEPHLQLRVDQPPITETAPVASSSNSDAIDVDVLEQFLVDFVIEHTGYPRDVVSLDADLEADLGIDSIKKAQLFGEFREMTGLATEGEGGSGSGSINAFRTLRQVLELAGSVTPSPDVSERVETSTEPTKPIETSSSDAGFDADNLEQFLVDFVIEHTGYPRDVVSLDADLEADLGIDSIKKAQLFGELREMTNLDSEVSGSANMQQFRTLGEVLEMVGGVASPKNEAVPTTTISEPVSEVVPSSVPLRGPNYLKGFQRAERERAEIVSFLKAEADRRPFAETGTSMAVSADTLTADQHEELRGLADGTGVDFGNILAHHERLLGEDDQSTEPESTTNEPETISRRFVLRMVDLPNAGPDMAEPTFSGAALIVGQNRVADALKQRLEAVDVDVTVLAPDADPAANVKRLEEIWATNPVPHLFLVTPCDDDAITTTDESAWLRRRQVSLMSCFGLCQRWVQLAMRDKKLADGSVIGVGSLGGDFGFSLKSGDQPRSAESGGLAGLMKAMCIENWVNGFRSTPVKIVDTAHTDSPENVVAGIWRELAAPSHDLEVSWHTGRRQVVRAVPQTVPSSRREIRRGGTWVCTGGARGVTAYVLKELAPRYDLKLHLIGTAPAPNFPPHWREWRESNRQQIKAEVMRQARESGENSVRAWQDTEKALEIDKTLQELADLGVTAVYHSCDVADRSQLAETLAEVRKQSGPIHGILHGAGIGRDARFDRKDMRKVQQCIRAKVDGALAMMELTATDPIEQFVGFGSISGRFGANGHTDYSLSNDMLAKLVGWYRSQRPDVAAVAFHWHAWDDCGMAVKPETRLALEMIDMQFMPAREGVEHLINELLANTPEPEVLITDERYYRVFNPAETRAMEWYPNPRPPRLSVDWCPMLERSLTAGTDSGSVKLTVYPKRDPFLVEHRVQDTPVMPLAVGVEILCEAAMCAAGRRERIRLRDIEALRALKFFEETPKEISSRIVNCNGNHWTCELVADQTTRDGRLVEADREYLRATVEIGVGDATYVRPSPAPDHGWETIHYVGPESMVYHGPVFQNLTKFCYQGDRGWAKISAPALTELASARRNVTGWTIPSAALDACLYATALLAWKQVEAAPSLPASMGELEVGRLTRPGEACIVETKFLRRDGQRAWFEFSLFGQNEDLILRAKGYEIAFLG
ncbi:type I polyketide synthase [Thalassoroseus pseudoceratinae]|uniref:type I polyketide synthase n=1 Tax=Thalassoroseus pseudoceratinae TaxID=2713176 RepID=UPI00141EE916|nr:type I polyketide synthase [Thalassoroseus pseudoceratinae]